MGKIYQQICNADQAQNGIEAILDTEEGFLNRGYVKVNSKLTQNHNPELNVLTEVNIPQHKLKTMNCDGLNPIVNENPIRIIAAMVNPTGDDAGFVKVTLVNISSTDAALDEWS